MPGITQLSSKVVRSNDSRKIGFFAFVFILLCCGQAAGQQILRSANWFQEQAAQGQLNIRIMDQNGGPLAGATITIRRDGRAVFNGKTTQTENLRVPLAPGSYEIQVQKDGFYPANAEKVTVVIGQLTPLEFRLQPVRAHAEEIDVTAQPSPIDPQQVAVTETLAQQDITNIPYPSTRDYRNILRFIPGVVQDNGGQIHIAGGTTQESQDYLDGYEVSNPSGGLGLRLSPDSLRKINVERSRYSTQFGKGSGGLATFESRDGDNRFRYSFVDFVPTLQNLKGIHFNDWTPRGAFSGPLVRNKAWFLFAHESENDLNIVKELPDGADSNQVFRTSELAKFRVNFSPRNTLTVDGVANLLTSQNALISPFQPVSASVNQFNVLFILGVKDQFSFAKDSSLEVGVAEMRTRASEVPQGNGPWIFTPETTLGNYYRTTTSWTERLQAFSNVFLHPISWHGTHQLAFGTEVAHVTVHQFFHRNPLQFLEENGVLGRETLFQNTPAFTMRTLEPSLYAQDRWSPFSRLLIEAGARWDYDSLIGKNFVSPRIAGTYLLHKASETKLSAGVGLYYDRTNLNLISRIFQGSRSDLFFDPASLTLVHPPLNSTFVANPEVLLMPRFTNWSAGIERRFPARIYARVDYLERKGVHAWGFEDQLNGTFVLGDNRRDLYRAVQLTARKEIKRGYPLLFAYTRSSVTTNQSLDFGPDSPVFGRQVSGPLLWDAPNQVTSWGILPLPKKLRKFDLAYSMLWRTGFPFVTVNQFQELVDGPAVHRFPHYFTLNPAIERKINFRGYLWALRVGIDNVTNSENPLFVNNVADSSFYLTFSGFGRRTLNGRIRLLGRN